MTCASVDANTEQRARFLHGFFTAISHVARLADRLGPADPSRRAREERNILHLHTRQGKLIFAQAHGELARVSL